MKSPKPTNLRKYIDEAKRRMRQLKKYAPYLLPEWQELEQAKNELKRAQRRVNDAQSAWDRLAK